MNIGRCLVDIRPFSCKWKTLCEVRCLSCHQTLYHWAENAE